MARLTKFRALGISGMKDGFWCFGFYYKQEHLHYGTILEDGILCAVNETTVGQFTGLLDKNGKEIYEGDIVKNHYGIGFKGTVVYEAKAGCYWIKWLEKHPVQPINRQCDLVGGKKYVDEHTNVFQLNHIEIIGNIYENKELL